MNAFEGLRDTARRIDPQFADVLGETGDRVLGVRHAAELERAADDLGFLRVGPDPLAELGQVIHFLGGLAGLVDHERQAGADRPGERCGRADPGPELADDVAKASLHSEKTAPVPPLLTLSKKPVIFSLAP
jgi:hypothetical protein